MIEIYYWLTDNGRKALQIIEETGLPHKKVPVNLTKREQFQPDYLKLSPGHKIPALVDDEGPGGARITLCESGAMLKYLAEKAGGALYPCWHQPRGSTSISGCFTAGSTFTPLAPAIRALHPPLWRRRAAGEKALRGGGPAIVSAFWTCTSRATPISPATTRSAIFPATPIRASPAPIWVSTRFRT